MKNSKEKGAPTESKGKTPGVSIAKNHKNE